MKSFLLVFLCIIHITANADQIINIQCSKDIKESFYKSNEFKKCRDKAIKLISKINWDNGFYRKDIGYKVID